MYACLSKPPQHNLANNSVSMGTNEHIVPSVTKIFAQCTHFPTEEEKKNLIISKGTFEKLAVSSIMHATHMPLRGIHQGPSIQRQVNANLCHPAT